MNNPRATPHSKVIDADGTQLAWFDDALLYVAGRAEVALATPPRPFP